MKRRDEKFLFGADEATLPVMNIFYIAFDCAKKSSEDRSKAL
jgi:hypothetical protein